MSNTRSLVDPHRDAPTHSALRLPHHPEPTTLRTRLRKRPTVRLVFNQRQLDVHPAFTATDTLHRRYPHPIFRLARSPRNPIATLAHQLSPPTARGRESAQATEAKPAT